MDTISDRDARFRVGSHDAYETLACAYDLLTAGYQHDLWLERLERLAIDSGLRGNRLLDVACGTGKSFLPMLERGYEVTACDISPAMLAIARGKNRSVSLFEADLRELPILGQFDLVTALDDPLNYLLDEGELLLALTGIVRNLAPGGVVIFDLNTLAQYRGQFARDLTLEDHTSLVAWRGRERNCEATDGALVEATIDVFTEAGNGLWQRGSSVHRQRHWSQQAVHRIADRAGLHIRAIRGQRPGVQLDDHLDELVHIKAIYVACREKGVNMTIGGL